MTSPSETVVIQVIHDEEAAGITIININIINNKYYYY